MVKLTTPILLVEDDEIDVLIVKDACKNISISDQLIVAKNGVEALKLLRDANREKPGVILLDLSMPKMDGFEFLRILKQDDILKTIPVIVVTNSKDEKDMVESRRLNIAGYFVKSTDYSQFAEMIKNINLLATYSLFDFPKII
ncbi:MAG: response regulator [Promethearchaeota archaeon]